MTSAAVRVGAVVTGPNVATIWEGMRAYFEDAGVPIVPVLFSSYEEQAEALFNRATGRHPPTVTREEILP